MQATYIPLLPLTLFVIPRPHVVEVLDDVSGEPVLGADEHLDHLVHVVRLQAEHLRDPRECSAGRHELCLTQMWHPIKNVTLDLIHTGKIKIGRH